MPWSQPEAPVNAKIVAPVFLHQPRNLLFHVQIEQTQRVAGFCKENVRHALAETKDPRLAMRTIRSNVEVLREQGAQNRNHPDSGDFPRAASLHLGALP
jgi:hypothetical protein